MNRLYALWASTALIFVLACGATEEPAAPVEKFAEGRQLMEQGAFEEAQAYFEGEIAAAPTDPETHFLAGQAAAMAANYGEAEAHLMKALELQPETAAYYDWLGRIYGAQARVGGLAARIQFAPKVKESFEKAVALDPGNAEAKFFLGMFYAIAPPRMGGDRVQAKAFADELVTSDPLSGHRLLAQYYVVERNAEAAEAEYKEAAALAPDDPQSYADLGTFYLAQKQVAPALENFDKALELDPDHQGALVGIGQVAGESPEHVARGIEALEKLQSLEPNIQSPNLGDASFLLGSLYESQGQVDQAVAAYQKAGEQGNLLAGNKVTALTAPAEPEAPAEAADEASTESQAMETGEAEAAPAEEAPTQEAGSPEAETAE